MANILDETQIKIESIEGQSHVIFGQYIIDLFLSNGEIKTLKDIYYFLSLHHNIMFFGQITNVENLYIFSPTYYSIVSI